MKWDKLSSQLSLDAATPQNSWKMQAFFLLLLFYMVEPFGSHQYHTTHLKCFRATTALSGV